MLILNAMNRSLLILRFQRQVTRLASHLGNNVKTWLFFLRYFFAILSSTKIATELKKSFFVCLQFLILLSNYYVFEFSFVNNLLYSSNLSSKWHYGYSSTSIKKLPYWWHKNFSLHIILKFFFNFLVYKPFF